MLKLGKSAGFLALFAAMSILSQPAGASESAESAPLDFLAGTWYEIARTDHAFERHLSNTAAVCVAEPDGTLSLSTRGLNERTGKWTNVNARARRSRDSRIEVMFFGFFPVSYQIVDVDRAYALISSEKLDKMWLLSRSKTVPEDVIEKYIRLAGELRISTDNLVRVAQND